ncbi:MAG: hypothetical protein IKY90_08940 [Oscillospiraceae bacterium]|nr:hypothetical protein [Oscillospiraceae bacterium]
MSRTSKITPEMEKEIVETYRNNVKIKEMEEMFGISNQTIYGVLRRQGVGINNPKLSSGKKRTKKRRCECGAVMPGEAKFCHMCGKSLKTDEEIIIDNLLKARAKCLSQCTAGIRSDVDSAIMAAVELLKVKCGVK